MKILRMKKSYILLILILLTLTFCSRKGNNTSNERIENDSIVVEETNEPIFTKDMVVIKKDLLYDKYTLDDQYPYKDTVRVFQWDKIKDCLFFIDSIQMHNHTWGIFRNYKNLNGEAALVRNFKRNVYKRVSDSLGIERYQSVPLYLPNDTTIAERYGRDGSLVKFMKDTGSYIKVGTIYFKGEWLVPKRYFKAIDDSIIFKKVIVVDRTNQNISTFEKTDSAWLVRSMNPATTGLHNPPYGQETPLGIFVVQEKKPKMIYLKDGTQETGGFAPNASRFTNGAYIHGVPVNAPRTQTIEYSQTLGTTPRSHMCVRNATSHAKFIYDWAPVEESLVFVIE